MPYMLATVLSTLANLATVLLLTRLLSPSDFGIYCSVLALLALLQAIGFAWLQVGSLRFYSRAPSLPQRAELASAMRCGYIGAVVVALLAWLALAVLMQPTRLGFAGLAASFLLLVLRGWLALVQVWNRASGRLTRFFFVEAVQSLGYLVLTLAMVSVWPGQPAAPLLAASCATFLAALIAPELVRLPFKTSQVRSLLRELLNYGLPVVLTAVLGAVLALSDRLLIAIWIGPAAAGVYSVAYSLSDRLLQTVLTPVPLAAKPTLFASYERGGATEARAVLGRSAAWLIVVGFPTATLLIFASDRLASLLVGGGMAEAAAALMPPLAVGSLLACIHNLHFSAAFQLARRMNGLLVSLAPAAFANVVLNLVLLPTYGIAAAAWTTVGCYALALVLTVIVGRQYVPVPWPVGTTIRSLVACVPTAMVLQLDLGSGVWAFGPAAGAAAAVYALSAAALHRVRFSAASRPIKV